MIHIVNQDEEDYDPLEELGRGKKDKGGEKYKQEEVG